MPKTHIFKKIDKKRLACIIVALVLLCLLLIASFENGFAALLDNEVRVEENSQLTYYLNISYDGVDKNGVKSDSTTVSEIQSGYLYVEDKIPEGLIFDGFVTTDDGGIGSIKKSDGSICPGKVIDDTQEASTTEGVWNADHSEYTYHGLHYNANTRTVNFTIKNLKAGCKLTVGIKTITPTVDDPTTTAKETRRDFYNFATIREKGLIVNSNTVHAFIGNPSATLYNVSYQFTGTIPSNAPSLPSVSSYVAGTKVGVATNINLEGYTFSGWSTTDATVSNGSFTMPSKNVVLKGSFTKMNTNKVTYELKGDTPSGYVLPLEKNYYAGTTVNVDSLKVGDVFNGYRFLGWKSNDVTISSENDFEMPNKNVVITGEFEEITYKVSYQFYDTVLPPNAENYLPSTKSYKVGSTVKIENITSVPSGYKFLGWYKEDEFKMPDHDVVIYGEWKARAGTFEPLITNEIITEREYYRVGDIVTFKITVTNPASFEIKDVIISENNDNSKFIAGDNYTILSDHVANITSIPAEGNVEVFATYEVLPTDKDFVENIVKIEGALADNYELVDKEYKASAELKIQSQLKICSSIKGAVVPNTFQYRITGTTNGYETWIALEDGQCETIFVDPSTYEISEIVPQEYQIKKIEGAISSNNETLVVEQGNDYEITYINEFRKKGFLHSFGRVINKVIKGGE